MAHLRYLAFIKEDIYILIDLKCIKIMSTELLHVKHRALFHYESGREKNHCL